MDNALIIDGVLAVILLVGTLIGAKRGLFKSLMGLVVVAAALVGAVFLAGKLAAPVTDFIAPKIENELVERFSGVLDRSAAQGGAGALDSVTELLERYGVSGDALQKVWGSISSGVSDAAAGAKEKALDTFRAAVSASVRAAVSGTVRAVLTVVLYLVLLFVLRLLTRALDHVFDLPVLGTVNGLGGALLGLLETALLLYVVLYLGAHLGVKALAEPADGARILPFFLDHSPVELIFSLLNKR